MKGPVPRDNPESLLTDERLVAMRAASRFARGSDLEDIAQETFLLSMRSSVPSGRKRSHWIASVARRIAIDKWRSSAARRDREESYSSDAGFARTDHSEFVELDAFETYMGRLNEPQRQIISLRYLQGLPFDQIAKELSQPIETVRTRHHRAIVKLREQLEEPTDTRAHGHGLGALIVGFMGRWRDHLGGVTGVAAAITAAVCIGAIALSESDQEAASANRVVDDRVSLAPIAPQSTDRQSLSDQIVADPFASLSASAGDEPKGNPVDAKEQQDQVRVIVIDSDGRPAASVPVTAYASLDLATVVDSGVTGPDGELILHARDSWVVAEHPDEGLSKLCNATLAGEEPVYLGLRKADQVIEGRLIDAEGRPVAGASVSLGPLAITDVGLNRKLQFNHPRKWRSTVSAEDGRFALKVASTVAWRGVVIERHGFAQTSAGLSELARGALVMPRGRPRTDPWRTANLVNEDGRPLDGWQVYVDPFPHVPLNSASQSLGLTPRCTVLQSDENGQIEFADRYSPAAKLMACSPDDPSGVVWATSTFAELEQTWTIDTPRTATGELRGVATPGSLLFLSSPRLLRPRRVDVDSLNGGFEVENVPAGPVVLDGRRANGISIPPTTIEVHAGISVNDLDLRVGPARFISIRLDPMPIGDVTLRIFRPDGSSSVLRSHMSKSVVPTHRDHVRATGEGQIVAMLDGRYEICASAGGVQFGICELDLDGESPASTDVVIPTRSGTMRSIEFVVEPDCHFGDIVVKSTDGEAVWRTGRIHAQQLQHLELPIPSGRYEMTLQTSNCRRLRYAVHVLGDSSKTLARSIE